MKKILYALIAGVMTLTGCSQSDSPLDIDPRAEVTTFTLAVDDATTRATSTIAPTRYVMEVWSEDGTQPENVFDNGTKNHAEAASGTFTAVLDQTKAYTCLFWADDNGTTYDAASLKAVALKDGQAVTEAYHATTAVAAGKNPAVAITLKRAVAKVTLEETAALEAGKTLAATYNQQTKFDVFAGKSIGVWWDKTTTTTLAADALTGKVAQFYLLATTEQSLTDFSFVYNGEEAKQVTNVPVQQNYITNIKGAYSSMLGFTFVVTADDAWESPDNGAIVGKDIYSNDTQAKKPTGDGSKENPYLIASAANVAWMQGTVNDSKNKYYKLTADIEVTADTWEPIGSNTGGPFYGYFDGGGHTITGKLTAATDRTDSFGFFGMVGSPGSIQYLTNSAEIIAPKVSWVGGIVGAALWQTSIVTITDCINTAKVTGRAHVGGIAGSYKVTTYAGVTTGVYSLISGCTNSGEIIAMADAFDSTFPSGTGGIAGQLEVRAKETITNKDLVTFLLKYCTNSGSVSGQTRASYSCVGGIAGYSTASQATLKIKGCTNTETIKCGDTSATADEGTPDTGTPGLILGGKKLWNYAGIVIEN